MALRKVTGQLVFQEKVDGKDNPLHHMLLELWDLDVILNDYLAMGRTGADGRFEIEYDSERAGWLDKPDLVLRVLQKEYYYNSDGTPNTETRVIASFEAGETTEAVFDFGVLRVAFWEYENPEEHGKVAFTPRVKVLHGETPQDQRPGRKVAQLAPAIRVLVGYEKHKLINKFNDEKPTAQKITEDYPPNLTRKLEEERPGYAHSDEYLTEMVLNGFNPSLLKKNDAGLLFVDFKWTDYEQDGVHFGPNTTAYFRPEEESPVLEKIEVQKRVGGDHGAHALYRTPRAYTKADGEVWHRVKRLFRVNYFLFGEALTHLGETHLNMEQYIVPIARNLHDNPVARLLNPHFYGTVAVNLAGNDLLISENGLVGSTSAATPASVGAIVKDGFGGYNWYGWKPRAPLGRNHRFAEASNLYWELLTGYVDWFFENHENEIRENWLEVHRMSRELVAHALPYKGSDTNWYDTNEINTADKPHPMVNGTRVAVSPVTESDTVNDTGYENLKQLCRYLLFFSTFKHKWVNDAQYDLGGDVMFATLGVAEDITNFEIDDTKAVPAKDALVHPFITYVLSNTKYGYILKNEDNDMNPELIKRLVASREKFSDLGLDIREIRSTINI